MERQKTITVFAGKGGVGKTTCAAATALHHASGGRRTLAISTDPTPSLSDIFEVSGKEKPARVSEFLYIHELGLDEIKSMWNTRFGREVYEVFSSFVDVDYPQFVDFMTSLLPGLGEEFMVDFIRELSLKDEYEVIIWDTAPLGQTLTLLETPTLLREHLRLAPRIYSKLRVGARSREPVLNILKRWEKLSSDDMDFLRAEVQFCIVTIAEALAVDQLEGIFAELEKYGLKPDRLIVNNVAQPDGSSFMNSRSEQQRKYLNYVRGFVPGLSVTEVPMFPREIKGLSRLNEIRGYLYP